MLKKAIETCQHKITQMIDHIHPFAKCKKIIAKYQNKHPIIDHYFAMRQKNRQVYFPQEEISQQIIQILRQQMLWARVIFIKQYFKYKVQGTQFSIFFNETQKFYHSYTLLKGQYKERYLTDLGFIQKDIARQWKCYNYVTLENYNFYSTQRIQKLHNKEKDYQFLQDRHDYIQWMFPNHFQSMFNSSSFPMSYAQVKIFRQSRKLGLKMLKSIYIFFDFLGLQLSQDYSIQVISLQRLKQALIINTHNHLRMRRLLACLSITGFRYIALNLIKFLGELVRTETPYNNLKRTFQRQWEIYGNNNLNKALQLCFHSEDKFPESHFVLQEIYLEFNKSRVIFIKSADKQEQYNAQNIKFLTQLVRNFQNMNKKVKMQSFESNSSSSNSQDEVAQLHKNNIMKQQGKY